MMVGEFWTVSCLCVLIKPKYLAFSPGSWMESIPLTGFVGLVALRDL